MMENKNYAIPIASVIGVHKLDKIFPIPNGPKILGSKQKIGTAIESTVYLLGVGIICKQALPIVVFSCETSSKPIPMVQSNLVLVLENGIDQFGLVIDKVKGIYEIPAEAIKLLDELQYEINPFADYALGVWENGGAPIWLLSPEKMVWIENK